MEKLCRLTPRPLWGPSEPQEVLTPNSKLISRNLRFGPGLWVRRREHRLGMWSGQASWRRWGPGCAGSGCSCMGASFSSHGSPLGPPSPGELPHSEIPHCRHLFWGAFLNSNRPRSPRPLDLQNVLNSAQGVGPLLSVMRLEGAVIEERITGLWQWGWLERR